MLTGLDIEEKANVFTNTLFNSVGGKEQFDEVPIQLHRTDKIMLIPMKKRWLH